MALFLDTEFNGHGGELISMALACQSGAHWYGIQPLAFGDPKYIHPWVQEHVIPVLHPEWATVTGDADQVRNALHDFLLAYHEPFIVADWSADLEHFFAALRGPTFDASLDRAVRARLIVTPPAGDPAGPDSSVPHNALSDAIALREWWRMNK